MAWKIASQEKPPLHQQVLVELKDGAGTVCDVAAYVGKVPIEGGGMEDRWILADVRLDTRQIKRWASIYPEPPRDELAELQLRLDAAVRALANARRLLVFQPQPNSSAHAYERHLALSAIDTSLASIRGEG